MEAAILLFIPAELQENPKFNLDFRHKIVSSAQAKVLVTLQKKTR
jgi:hypothetical protein